MRGSSCPPQSAGSNTRSLHYSSSHCSLWYDKWGTQWFDRACLTANRRWVGSLPYRDCFETSPPSSQACWRPPFVFSTDRAGMFSCCCNNTIQLRWWNWEILGLDSLMPMTFESFHGSFWGCSLRFSEQPSLRSSYLRSEGSEFLYWKRKDNHYEKYVASLDWLHCLFSGWPIGDARSSECSDTAEWCRTVSQQIRKRCMVNSGYEVNDPRTRWKRSCFG